MCPAGHFPEATFNWRGISWAWQTCGPDLAGQRGAVGQFGEGSLGGRAGGGGILWGHLWTAGGLSDAYGQLPW